MQLPKHYDAKEVEKKWQEYWEKENIFGFDKDDTRREIFAVDTPPPTVSGQMHLGHAFSYAQEDFVIRFQRMLGKNVFYPFGTDDNGLATDRLVEKLNNVRSKDFKRKEYIKLCLKTLEKIRPDFIQDWKNIGVSCDFSIFYSTINDHCRKISQKSFIDLYNAGREYRKEAPTIFCPECHTAIAQVELEDKELSSTFNDIVFRVDGKDLIIATTRPELLSSCVAVFFHPDDKRYMRYGGKKAKVPLFDYEVPILMDERVDVEKGTGIVMCCTFGDQTDIEWYKAHNLPLRISINHDGLMNETAGKYQGMRIKQARKEIINDLRSKGLLRNQKQITHTVNVHERCGTAIEILNTKQWFIRYLDLKDKFLQAGAEMTWYPDHMRVRLDHWINGLQWDWCISRQRHFGVPFPVWYCRRCDEVILAREKDLPVDPIEDQPPVKQCPKCKNKEFIPEKDVLDTWATSSLTPQLAVELMKGTKNYKKLFPMDLRPQAHDIITFWLFNTMVKSQLHFKKNPWKNIMISGWALDPKGKKMSKSKGNVISPQEMIKKYSADCIRFWAAGSKLGEDLPFQEKDLVTGRKMTTKLWNASKFVIMHLEDFSYHQIELEPMDKWLLTKLQKLIKSCTDSFDKYEYSKVKQEAEIFFWSIFCDYYLEMVKDRLYNTENYDKEEVLSAKFALYEGLLTLLKLIAPIMPYVTEEIYQLYFSKIEKKKSIHISKWPSYNKEWVDNKTEVLGDIIVLIISEIRKFKALNNLSMAAPIKRLVIECNPKTRKQIELMFPTLTATAKIVDIEFGKGTAKIVENFKIKIEN
ncbi:valine--tRNA ligase [Candidatus Woesearchaeota archaeon]|nr:valine--tRNA ligase [Candidatus Woesearchaeota archaeon]